MIPARIVKTTIQGLLRLFKNFITGIFVIYHKDISQNKLTIINDLNFTPAGMFFVISELIDIILNKLISNSSTGIFNIHTPDPGKYFCSF